MFKRVRLDVRRKTRGAQVPWESTSLDEDFWFLPPKALTQIAEERTRKESGERTRTQAEAEAERKARAEARAKREREERESAESQRKFKEELARWESIKDWRNPEDFHAFLLERQSGYISEQAQFRLDQLEKPVVQEQPGANGIKPLASGANRYALGDAFQYDYIDRYTNIAKRFVNRVTYADNDRVEFNGGAQVNNQMGGLLVDRFGTKKPALITEPAELAPGKRWRNAYINTRPDRAVEECFLDFHVIGLEDVTVPAGTFKTYMVEGAGMSRYPGGSSFLSQLRWIDPATMISVRIDLEFRGFRGRMFAYSSLRLVSAKRAALKG